MPDDFVAAVAVDPKSLTPARCVGIYTGGLTKVGPHFPPSKPKRIRTFHPATTSSANSVKIYEAIKRRPKKTSGQIAKMTGLSHHAVNRAMYFLLRERFLYRDPEKRYTVTACVPPPVVVLDPRSRPIFDRAKLVIRRKP